VRTRLPDLDASNPWSRALDARRAAGRELIDLTDANPTQVGLSEAGPELLGALADPRASRYAPEAAGALRAREAVAASEARAGRVVDPRDIVLTSGTSESYAHLFRLLANPGERVAAPAPGYPLIGPLAQAEGVELEPYWLVWDGRWVLDLDSVDRALERGARAVVVIEPNHPTGSCLAPAELDALEDRCARHGAALISDEVFADFPWPPAAGSLPSLLQGERRVATFALGGLSKACGLPQMKLGWIALAGPARAKDEARRGLEWLADLFLSVGGPVQAALPRLLEERAPFAARVGARLAANLAAARAACAAEPQLELREAQGGWAAVLRLPARRSGERWALDLIARGVAIHPGHFYELEGGAFLVASLVVEPAAFAEGMRRLVECVRDS
jgi:aspartate/methionine/tyrosine aminotransferase